MRVVVVGAGLAGLRTAHRLLDAGVDVELIEAGRRPGGRVRTVRQTLGGSTFAAGQYSESGAEWVDSVHHRLLELMDRYGVGLLGEGERWTVIRRWLYWKGELLSPERIREVDPGIEVSLEAFEDVVAEVAAGISDPSRPDLHPEAARHDARSLADAASQAGLSDLALLFKRRDSQGEFAEEPNDVSLLFVAQQRALQAAEAAALGDPDGIIAQRSEGGFSRVAEGLATEVGHVLHLGESLLALEQTGDSVVVTTNLRTIMADHVVLATSLVPLRTIDWRGGLPDDLRAAVYGLGYGAITKTSVQWPRRAWPSGYATTESRAQRVYEPTIDQSGDEGILMAYCGGQGGREWALLDESTRVEQASRLMAEMHGITDAPLGGWSRAWSAQPRFGGSYAVYRPGEVTRYWDVLRRPWGRVHLAGEHVATCTGYMEGALESGDTVAARLCAAG